MPQEKQETPEPSEKKSFFAWIVSGLGSLGTVLIICLMVLINMDVLGRNIFGAPVPGVIELTEAAIVMVVFLQIGQTLRYGRFPCSDGFFNWLEKQKPGLATILSVFYNVTGALLFLLIILAMYPHFIDSWNGEYFKGIPGSFTIPIWPINLTILVGSGVMFFQFIILGWQKVKIWLIHRSIG